jgi:phage FluMu gp28-like protein
MPLALTETERRAADAWLRTFHPYQTRWMLDPARFAACNKGRQLGLSHGNAGGCIVGGLLQQRPQILLSASQDLSDEVMLKVRAHCALLADLGFTRANDFTTDNASEIAWRTGGRVVSLPANPRTARSYTGDVWLDEFAYHQDPIGIRDAAFPMAMRGGWRIRIVSTPNGAQGLFHELVTAPPRGWSLHRIPLERAIADGLEVDLDALWSLCGGDERVFNQWFRCAFLDGDLQYIPTHLADAALRWTDTMPALDFAEIHAGLDVGRHHDLSVLTIVAVVGSVAWVLAVIPWKRTAFRDQRRNLIAARDTFQWSTIHIDKGGLGEQLTEELVDDWGESEVKAVAFTNPEKESMATRAFRWFRDNRVRFPRGPEGVALRDETIAVRRVITNSGNVVYSVPRSSKGHGDRWWSLCLALKGAGEPPLSRGVGKRPVLAVA